MKFYSAARLLYLDTNTSGIGLRAGLLQVMDGMNDGHDKVPYIAIMFPNLFANKSLSSTGCHYSNIESEALGNLYE